MSPGKSVLLVDDSRDLSALIERALRQVRPGTVVFPLPSGERALEHLLQCGERYPFPDLVLLDRHMPGGMDGFETLQSIRAVERLEILPVIMFCGSDAEEHVARARIVGADGYIRKPVVQDEVLGFARQLAAWCPEESWRRFGGTASGLALLQAARLVGSGQPILPTMPIAAANVPPNVEQSLAAKMGDFFQFVMETARQVVDPVDRAINEACRRHNIPVRHAKGTSQDQVTVKNRQAVYHALMDVGFSDLVILENFSVSKRQLERIRAEWRAKGGGVLTLGNR